MSSSSKVIVVTAPGDADARAARQLQLGLDRDGIPVQVAEVTLGTGGATLGASLDGASLVLVSGTNGTSLDTIRAARTKLAAASLDIPLVFSGTAARADAEAAGADEVVVSPAYLRDVVTVARLLRGQPAAKRAHLIGSLAETTNVFTLVRALCALGRSAVLTLMRGLRRGEIRFFHGEVTSAELALIHGQAALHQLLLWTEARFEYLHEDVVRRQQIPMTHDELFADAERFLEGVRESSGSLSPAQVLEPDVSRIQSLGKQVPTEVHGVLHMFDGHRVLADILEDSPYRVFETLRVTQRAVEAGLLRVVESIKPKATWRAVLGIEEWLTGQTGDEAVATARADISAGNEGKPDDTVPRPRTRTGRDVRKKAAPAPASRSSKPDIDWGALVPRVVGAEVGSLSTVVPAAQRSGEISLPTRTEEPRERLEALMDTAQREKIFVLDQAAEDKVTADDKSKVEDAKARADAEAKAKAKAKAAADAKATADAEARAELERRATEERIAISRKTTGDHVAAAAKARAEAAQAEADAKLKAEAATKALAEAEAAADAAVWARAKAEAELSEARADAEAKAKADADAKAKADADAKAKADADAKAKADADAKAKADADAKANAAAEAEEAGIWAKAKADAEAAQTKADAEAAQAKADADAKAKADSDAKAKAAAKAHDADEADLQRALAEEETRRKREEAAEAEDARLRSETATLARKAAAARAEYLEREAREAEELHAKVAATRKSVEIMPLLPALAGDPAGASSVAAPSGPVPTSMRDNGSLPLSSPDPDGDVSEEEMWAMVEARARAAAASTETRPVPKIDADELVRELKGGLRVTDLQQAGIPAVPRTLTPSSLTPNPVKPAQQLKGDKITVEESPTATVVVQDTLSVRHTEKTAHLVSTTTAVVTEPVVGRTPTPDLVVARSALSSGAPTQVDDDPSDGIVREIPHVDTAPLQRRPPAVPDDDDRPEARTGEIVLPRTRTNDQRRPGSQPSILIEDLQAAQAAIAAVAIAQANVHAPATANLAASPLEAAVADARSDAVAARETTGARETFSDAEEEFFRAGREKEKQSTFVNTSPVEKFDDLDEGYQPVGFWDRLRGKKPEKK